MLPAIIDMNLFEEARQYAKQLGSKCLSSMVPTTKAKLLWRCSPGHQWEARFSMVKRGSWCLYCSGRRRTIADMQALPRKRDDTCLSIEYQTPKTKLLWRCSKDHEWYATPNSVQQGHWCPECAGNTKKSIQVSYLI